MHTAELCHEALQLCRRAALLGNKNVMSDAGVGACMAFAGLQGAIFNVRINLPHTKDEAFIAATNQKLNSLLHTAQEICDAVQREVAASFA